MIIVQKDQNANILEIDGTLTLIMHLSDKFRIEIDDGTVITGDFENDNWIFKNGLLKSKKSNINVKVSIYNSTMNIGISCGILRDSSLVNATVNAGCMINCSFIGGEVALRCGLISKCSLIDCSGSVNVGNVSETIFNKCHDMVFNGTYNESVIFEACERFYFCGLKVD